MRHVAAAHERDHLVDMRTGARDVERFASHDEQDAPWLGLRGEPDRQGIEKFVGDQKKRQVGQGIGRIMPDDSAVVQSTLLNLPQGRRGFDQMHLHGLLEAGHGIRPHG